MLRAAIRIVTAIVVHWARAEGHIDGRAEILWHLEVREMKKLLATLLVSVVCTAAMAQVGTTMKEGAKATGEKAEQYGDQAKGAVSTQPSKTVDKAKAQVHKAKAHAHAKAAKDAAKDVPK